MEKPLKRNTELKMTMKQTKELILIVEEDQDGDKSYQDKIGWRGDDSNIKGELGIERVSCET